MIKKTLLIPITILVLIYLSYKKMKNIITPNAPAGFQRVKAQYGEEFAKKLEQMMRLETNHFKSSQWLKTGTAGMVSFGSSFPWGWSSLETWSKVKGLQPSDFFVVPFAKTSDGKPRTYIGFKDTGRFVDFMAWYIHNRLNDDFASWYLKPNMGFDAERQKYIASMANIRTQFV